MKGGRVLSGHIVVMLKALCNSLHTFWIQVPMDAMERAFGESDTHTPVICQIKECSGFNATSFLSIYSLSTALHGLRAPEIAREMQC